MTNLQSVLCPNCGETFETGIDVSSGNQEYVEDCYVCCRPIVFLIEIGADGELKSLETRCEND